MWVKKKINTAFCIFFFLRYKDFTFFFFSQIIFTLDCYYPVIETEFYPLNYTAAFELHQINLHVNRKCCADRLMSQIKF